MPSLYLPLITRLHTHFSPLVHKDLCHALTQAKKKLENPLPHKEAELLLISVGKKLWPYQKAFSAVFSAAEERLGPEFLLSHLSRPLKNWFKAFQSHGGTLAYLHKGSDHMFFHLTPEEKTELTHALMETRAALYRSVHQEILSHNQSVFEEKVHLFEKSLASIEKRIAHLQEMAQKEKNRALAAEMNSLAHECELVFAGLAPAALLDHLHHCEEHFEGRRADKKTHEKLPKNTPSFNTSSVRRTIFDLFGTV